MDERHPMNGKQVVVTLLLAATLWVPMMTFIFLFSQSFSPRQVGAIGLIKILVSVSIMILVYRRWIRQLR
jgi:hypothetical protein